MNPYLLLGVVVAWGASVAGAFFYGKGFGEAQCEAAVAREERIGQIATDRAQTAAAEAISRIEVKNVTQRQILQREVVEVPVYRDCKHSDAGLRAVNEALVPTGTDSRAVPAADPAR